MLINFVGARHLVESAVESMMPEGSSIAFISSIGGLGWEKVLNRVLEFLDTPDFASAQRGARSTRPEHRSKPRRWRPRTTCLEAGHRRVRAAAGGAALSPRHPYQRHRPGAHHDALDGLHAHMADVRRHALQGGDERDPQTPEEQAPPLVFLNSPAAHGVSGQILNVTPVTARAA